METNLVGGGHLDSFSMLSLVADLEEEFDVKVPAVDINPDNFNSLESISLLVSRLREEGRD